ncbi:MAG: hypothetical protein ACKOYM_10805 [Actinomycetes bacterium]
MVDTEAPETPERPSSRRWLLPVVLCGVVVLVSAVVIGVMVTAVGRAPEFPSLSESPDAALKGTVAYLDWEADACLWTIDASGANRRKVTCLQGVNAGTLPTLTWRDATTIEVTLFGAWQKRVDLSTGRVTNVPAAEVPDRAPDLDRSVSSDGRKVRLVVADGRSKIVVEGGVEDRVLLDVATSNTYSVSDPAWSPDGAYVLTGDSAARLLLTTTGANPTTRVLATEHGGPFAVQP